VALSLLAKFTPGQLARGHGPGGSAGNTRTTGSRSTSGRPEKGRPTKGRPTKGRPTKGRPTKGRPTKGRPAKGAVKGATRRTPAEPEAKRPSAWVNRFLILLGAGVVLAAAAQAWVTLHAIPVQRITVTGELEHTQREAVQDMVQPALAGGFLRADLTGIRAQLESMPWIYEASVRRRWPAALEIHVVEQLPIARWGEDSFLNHEGGIFHSGRSAEWQDLPLLSGPDGSARDLMRAYRRMVDMLAPLGLKIEQLGVDQRGQLEAQLEGGARLLLGSSGFLERMHRFVALYRGELAAGPGEVERVDLRYASGVAVVFAEPAQVAGL
jgi:cell division protein FtsQ